MDPNYNPDRMREVVIADGMADKIYLAKGMGKTELRTEKPVAVRLNIGRATGRALAWCGTNHVMVKPQKSC